MEHNSSQLFQCFICYEEAVDPRLCPYCSKIACYQCLLIYLQSGNQNCPHCKSKATLDQFAKCNRFINQLKNAIGTKENKQKKSKLCIAHEIQLSYYCLNCNKSICSDCIIFSAQHKQHSIEKLSTIYKDKKSKIVEELSCLDDKIQQHQTKMEKIKYDKQRLIGRYEVEKQKIKKFVEKLLQKLKQQKQQNQYKINKQLAQVQKDIEMLSYFRQGIKKELEKQSQTYLMHSSDDIFQCIQNFCKQDVQYQQSQICFKIIDDIIPKFYTFTVVLEDFLSRQQQYFYSEPHNLNGIEWRAKIYPKGISNAKNTHVSIFIEMKTKLPIQKNYIYQIELINHQNPNKTRFRQYQSLFQNGSKWGYDKFIEIYDLSQGFLNEQGHAVLKIGIRNACYGDLVDEMSEYLMKIQRKLQQVQQKQQNESFSMVVKSQKIEDQ